MSKPMHSRTILSLTLLLASMASRPGHAQDPLRLPEDFVFKKVDEWWLQHNQARLQNDINRGDTIRVNRDLNRIQRDEWRIWYDRRRIRRDLWLPLGPWVHSPQPIPLGGTLIAHPQYPGYGYDPSNPTQLYQLPQTVPFPNPVPSEGVSAGSVSGSTPGVTATPAQVPVVIVNAGESGIAIDYVIDGVAYKTESGQQQRLAVSPTSTILYNRGGDLGEQRYALSAGVYEFRSSDTGWALFKLPPTPPEDASRSLFVLVPKNDLPATTGAPKAGESSGNGSGPQR
jgi:hypothetical protein